MRKPPFVPTSNRRQPLFWQRVAVALCSCLAPVCYAQTAPSSTPEPTPVPAQPASPSPSPAASPAPAMLSSRAAYDEALRPLDLTRRDMGNWSDAEVAALNLAVQQAGSACALRDPMQAPVDDLVDLARLCGVGQNWAATMSAAHRYIEAPQAAKPQLALAYADAVEAELHLKMSTAAFATGKAMFAAVPYDSTVSGAYNLALDYLQFSSTAEALALAQAAQPVLLASLRPATDGNPSASAEAPAASGAPDKAAAASTPSSAELSVTQRYRDALRLPAVEIYLGRLKEASAEAAGVEAALPPQLAGDDILLVAAERRRFALLGHHLPLIDVAESLDPRTPATELPFPGLTTTLLLFPDWCAQCVRMGAQFPQGKFTVGGRPAVFFALLAPTRPSSRPVNYGAPSTAAQPGALQRLGGTPTLLVPPATLLQLEATDFPLLLLVDEHGIVRVHQAVGEDALQSGGTVDSAIAGMGPGAGSTRPAAHPTEILRAPAPPGAPARP